jgi:hypothetical protein
MIKKYYNKLWSPVFFIMAIISYILNCCNNILCVHEHHHTNSSNLDFLSSLNSMTVMWFIMGLAHLGSYLIKNCNCNNTNNKEIK